MNGRAAAWAALGMAAASEVAFAYPWPLTPSNQQHEILSTVGDLRGTDNPFQAFAIHDGVDIAASPDVLVFSVTSGFVFEASDSLQLVRVATYKYQIIRPEAGLTVGFPVSPGTPLGVVLPSRDATAVLKERNTDGFDDHIHFSDGLNPLDGGLAPYVDFVDPTAGEVQIFRDTIPTGGLVEGASFDDLSGTPVIIGLANIKTSATSDSSVDQGGAAGPRSMSVFQLGYRVLLPNGQEFSRSFPCTLSNPGLARPEMVYATPTTANPVSYSYWVTNQCSSHASWNSQGVPDGSYKVQAVVRDTKNAPAFGRAEFVTSSALDIIVDNQPPQIGALNPAPDVSVGDRRQAISAALADAGSGVAEATMELDGIQVASAFELETAIGFVPAADLDYGTHTVTVYATDRLPGRVSTVTWNFFLIPDVSSPTTPAVLDEGESTPESTAISAAWSAADPESGISDYRVAVGLAPGGEEASQFISFGAATAGSINGLNLTKGVTYYVSVVAVNGTGLVSPVGASDGIVVVNMSPVAAADGPYGGFVGQAIALDGSMSFDSDGDALTYQWKFGDGSIGTGVAPSHIYSSSGTYRVSLAVNDGKVSSKASISTATISVFTGRSMGWNVLADFAGGDQTGTSVVPQASPVPSDGQVLLTLGPEELMVAQNLHDIEKSQVTTFPQDALSEAFFSTFGFIATKFAPLMRAPEAVNVPEARFIAGDCGSLPTFPTSMLTPTFQYVEMPLPPGCRFPVYIPGVHNPYWGSFRIADYTSYAPQGNVIHANYRYAGNTQDVLPSGASRSFFGEVADWTLRLWGRQYPPSGEYVSPSLVVPTTNFAWGPFIVDDDKPLLTNTSYFIQVGPDGVSWEPEQPIIPGRFIASSTQPYVRWRVQLLTSDQSISPTVKSVKIFYRDLDAPDAASSVQANGSDPSPWTNTPTYTVSLSTPNDPSEIIAAHFKSEAPPAANSDGVRVPGISTFAFTGSGLANGANALFVWLEDAFGNQDFRNFASVTLRFDDVPPTSIVSSLPLTSTKPVEVRYVAEDPGSGDVSQTGSGVGEVKLWASRDTNDDGVFGPWTLVVASQSPGGFSYDPGVHDGAIRFYVQAIDVAGNAEPAPLASTPPKAETFYDATPPVLSNVRLPVVSFAQAHVAWETDDRATGLVEYGTTTALGHSRATALGREHLAVLDCSLFSPATIYYRITAVNRTGLTTVSPISSFITPPQVTVPSDLFGVIDASLPIDVQITNPDIMSATFTVDGQTGSVVFSTSTGFQIRLDPSVGGGVQTLRIVLNGFTYETQFIVDTATRSVRLARAVVDGAGVMTDTAATPGSSVAEMTLGEAAQEAMSGPASRLYLGYYAAIDPAAPSAVSGLGARAGPGAGQVTLDWTAVGDDAGVGTAMKYDLRRSTSPISGDADFAAAAPVALTTYPALAGTAQGAVVSGLADGSTYYFAVKALDELLNASPFGGGAQVKTLEVARSTELTNGRPTVEFLSFVPGVSITQISTTSTFPGLALATSAAAAQGLLFYTTIFDIISPDPSLPGGATVQFRYPDPGDPTLEAGLRLYEFKPELDQWLLVADAGPNAAQDLFFLPIPGLSFYAVFYRDRTAPITSLELRGGRQFIGSGGAVFASTSAAYGLLARDPPENGSPGSGVARTEYRVDSSNAPFTLLPSTGAIALPAGVHTVHFRSVDNAGNVEAVRSAVIAVDAAAPAASVSADAPSVPSSGGLAVLSATTTLTVSIQDPLVPSGAPGGGSGVESVYYSLDGAGLTAASASFSLLLGTGTHQLSLLAQDRVGNLLDGATSPLRVVVGDALPPRSAAEFGSPSVGTDPVYLGSATPIVLRSVDDLLQLGDSAGLGVAFQEAALTSLSSGTSRTQRFTAAVSTFLASTEADGLYALEFFAEDAAGNREAVRRATVAVDNTPPLTALAPGSPSYAGARLFVSTRTLLGFAAEDPVVGGAASGVGRTLYAADGGSLAPFSSAFSLSGGTHTVVFQSFDRLDNAEVLRSTLLAVDADAPLTALSFLGPIAAASSPAVPADAAAFLSAASAVTLAAEETGSTETASGAAYTRYRLGDGAFQVYGGTFSVETEGLHQLAFQSLDRVDNEESLRLAAVAVDTTPPSVESAVHGPSYLDGGRLFVSSASLLGVAAQDPVSGGVASGLGVVEFRVDAAASAPFELFTSSFALAGGPHLVELRGRDRVGNESAAQARSVFVDTVAPISTLSVGLPQADLGGGVLLVSPETPLLVVSSDPAQGGAASGVRETLVAVDSGAFAVSAGTFTLPGEGARAVRFFARDNVLNEEGPHAAALVVDAAPPVAALLSPSPSAVGVDQAFGRGLVPVVATVSDVHLSGYTLEYAAGVDAQGGFSAVASGTAPVVAGVIARWDASALSGFYTLRLSAVDALGAVSLSTAAVFIGDPQAVMIVKNQDGHGENDELLHEPEGVAVGAGGSIYVANTGKDQVLRFGPDGGLLGAFDGKTLLVREKKGRGKEDDKDGKGKGGKDEDDDEQGKSESITFHKPTGLAVDEAGNVYVADRDNDRVAVLSATGTVLRSIGRTNPEGRFIPGKGAGEFNKPTGVALSASGIAVADRNNGRVQVFDRDFAFLYQIRLDEAASVSGSSHEDDDDDDEDGKAFAVAWGPEGTLYVTEDANDRVLHFDAQGALLAVLGSQGPALGQFEQLKGAAASALGSLYVADRGNKRVQKFDPYRNAVLAFGASAGLEQPTGLAQGGAGFLYVTDRKTDRLLKLGLPAPTSVVTAPPPAAGKVKKGKVSRGGGKLSRPDRVTVDIPAGALAQELEISIEPERATDPDEEARKKQAKEQKSLAAVSEGVEYGPEGTQFNAPVTLTLVYDPKSLPPGVKEEDLKVHYWNPAKSEWEAFPSTVDKELHTVSAQTLHFSLYQVLAPGAGTSAQPLAADPGFGLKAAYAFPNPVRGQRMLTIRVQPGLADSLEVRVYDVSGRKVHESSTFADRGAFDDGNGLGAQYTYDHVWDVGGVGSGVYTYVVVARKAGQSAIRKTGRVAIIK